MSNYNREVDLYVILDPITTIGMRIRMVLECWSGRRNGSLGGVICTKILTEDCSDEDPSALKLELSFNRWRSMRGRIMTYFFLRFSLDLFLWIEVEAIVDKSVGTISSDSDVICA